MFVGRQHELEQLNRAYKSGQFECVVISGRRHIGKTALISAFIADKDAIYFSARELTDKYNREPFTDVVCAHYGKIEVVSTDWEPAFEMIANRVEDKRAVLVLDNYLIRKERRIRFQKTVMVLTANWEKLMKDGLWRA